VLKAVGIPEKARAEELGLGEMVRLYQEWKAFAISSGRGSSKSEDM
jgi:hypothetical protein